MVREDGDYKAVKLRIEAAQSRKELIGIMEETDEAFHSDEIDINDDEWHQITADIRDRLELLEDAPETSYGPG